MENPKPIHIDDFEKRCTPETCLLCEKAHEEEIRSVMKMYFERLRMSHEREDILGQLCDVNYHSGLITGASAASIIFSLLVIIKSFL